MGLNTDIRQIAREVFRDELEQRGLSLRPGVTSDVVGGKLETPARPDISGKSRDDGGPPPPPAVGGAGSRPAPKGGGHLIPRAPANLAQPNLDAAEAAWFLRYTSMKAFYQAVHRYGIPHARRGARVMLFRRADLEKFIASRTRDR